MSKILYLSHEKSEGLMTSLGLETQTITPETDVQQLLRQYKRQGISMIFVSESVYQEHQEIIEKENKDFDLTISILANQKDHQRLGAKRLKSVIEEAVGIKVK